MPKKFKYMWYIVLLDGTIKTDTELTLRSALRAIEDFSHRDDIVTVQILPLKA